MFFLLLRNLSTRAENKLHVLFFFLFFFLLRDLSTRGENKLQVPSNHNPSKAVSNEDQKEIFISVMLAFISLHLSNKEES